MPTHGISRRSALAAVGLTAGLGPAGLRHAAAAQPANSGGAGGAGGAGGGLRLAHLTDTHIQPERRADQGVAACLRHVSGLERAPDLVITGGDLIMDGFGAEEARVRALFDMFVKTFRDGVSAPVHHCLGNHDIWGWNRRESKTRGDEPRYGKRWAVEALGLERPFYAFDRGAWRFVILDSVAPSGEDGYMARLDDEQFAWLASTLADTPAGRHVCVVSHIPIVSASALFDNADRRLEINPGILHTDGFRLHRLFAERGNVRLCLSGHIHQVDRVDYEGVSYICDGAVSGAWWKGRHHRCDEGYGLIDLADDGTFRHAYTTYGWKADPE